MHRGTLVVVSGFSGAGKGTVMKKLLSKYDNYCLSISATTRKPRLEDEEGVTYFFKTNDEFEKMIRENAFLEYAGYADHYYGTPREFVESKLSSGHDVILEIERQGAMEIKKTIPEAILIFITPPSVRELKQRLTDRGTEKAEIIQQRLAIAKEESLYMDQYDYLILNETSKVDACVEELHRLIQSSHRRTSQNQELIRHMQHEFDTEL